MLDLEVFVDSMQLVSNTSFQITITLVSLQKNADVHTKATLWGPLSLAMTACSRIEINAAMPVTAASLSYAGINLTGYHPPPG